MILLIVYVGAVAVLFLFVVMMLNVGVDKIKTQAKKYFFSGFLVAIILLLELIFSFSNLDIIFNKSNSISLEISNSHALEKFYILTTFYLFKFLDVYC